MGETNKARARRIREGFFNKFIRGNGIDIGCGDDPVTPHCALWDYEFGHGDATLMQGVPDACYDWVHASHILEHLVDPHSAVRNWWRILKPGGWLIIAVPHQDLYEKKNAPPSNYDPTHVMFYRPEDLLRACQAALGDFWHTFYSLRVLDEGHVIQEPDIHSDGEYSIEIILHKP